MVLTERVPQTGSLQALDLGRHGSREKRGAALAREEFQNFLQDGSEVHVEKTIRLVYDKILNFGKAEPLRLLQMVQKTALSCW